jgi:KDO2-lipid IV(A) lauroyltransferase
LTATLRHFMQTLTGWLGRGLSFALFYSPRWIRQTIAWTLATLWFDVLRIRRQVVLDNLHLAFPQMSHTDRVRMGRRSLYNLGLNLVEYCYLPWLSHSNYQRYFRIETPEVLERSLAKGKGVLLLTLHLGHGDLGCAALSLHGFPMVMVSKVFKLRWLNDLWFGMRERLGTRFIAPRDSSYALLKALKQKRVVIIPLDQFTGPPIGVRTSFFGVETGTAAGLAVMAGRSGAPVVSCYTFRDRDGTHVLRFEREIEVERSRSEQEIAAVTQSFNDELEKYVRLYPDQWMWIHRRWKRFVVQ